MSQATPASGRWPEVLRAFLKLGLTSFGGPVAHLGYFRGEFVARPPGFGLALPIGRGFALICLVLFFALLVGLPILAAAVPNHAIALAASFYRSGSLVFGGGHVVLPLLQASVVPPGWVTDDVFLAGYGAAQAFLLLTMWRTPPWLVVVLAAITGHALV